MDTVATGVTYASDIAVDTGIMEEAGSLAGAAAAACTALPFVVIAAMEGTKAILGRKPAMNATKDAARRMLKTGAALGLGAAAASAAGLWAAVPVAMGTRMLADRIRSSRLEGIRVEGRIRRLKSLREQLDREAGTEKEEALPQKTLEVPGTVI